MEPVPKNFESGDDDALRSATAVAALLKGAAADLAELCQRAPDPSRLAEAFEAAQEVKSAVLRAKHVLSPETGTRAVVIKEPPPSNVRPLFGKSEPPKRPAS